MQDILLYYSFLHQGDWNRIYQSIDRKEPVDWSKMPAIKAAAKGQFITLLSPEYPQAFRHIECPPFVLYYKGNLELLRHEPMIAVVGSRRATVYGERTARKLVEDFGTHGWGIVSGLAKGIDAIAHTTCLDYEIPTIAVIGGGIDTVYPPENALLYERISTQGLILSEYPTTTPAQKEHFPFRNRLVAALGKGVVIVEARSRSGTLTTVRHALNQGKEIFCVPERVYMESACNQLIQQGAKLLVSAQDVYEEYGMQKNVINDMETSSIQND